MDDHTKLTINKSTANIPFRRDADIDLTAIRIGKNRVARRKGPKISDLKQAILLQRSTTTAPSFSVEPDEIHRESQPPDPPTDDISVPYFDHSPSDRLNELMFRVLKELSRIQARGSEQPLEKRYKYKRIVTGIREVHRALIRGDIEGIVVATNLERGVEELDNLITGLKNSAEKENIPFIIALNKRRIGKALSKSMKQSVVGITSLEGVYPEWREILAEVGCLRTESTCCELGEQD